MLRLSAVRCESRNRWGLRRNDSELTPTELLSAVSEMLRAMRLGPMELALWYRRRPDEDNIFTREQP